MDTTADQPAFSWLRWSALFRQGWLTGYLQPLYMWMTEQGRQCPCFNLPGLFDRSYPFHFQSVFDADDRLGNNGYQMHGISLIDLNTINHVMELIHSEKLLASLLHKMNLDLFAAIILLSPQKPVCSKML